METLTEQALSLARAGASEEARATVDLAEIVRTLCGELTEMGVNVSAEANTPLMCECRPSEIARALRNLVENAAKYGGGGVMRAYRNETGDAVVEVTDEGPGVPPGLLAKLTAPSFAPRRERAKQTAPDSASPCPSHRRQPEAVRAREPDPERFSAKLVLPG